MVGPLPELLQAGRACAALCRAVPSRGLVRGAAGRADRNRRVLGGVGAVGGLFVETLMLAPAAIVYLVWVHTRVGAGPINTPETWGLLALSGPVTTIPLLWFIAAAKRLPLSTIGFLQYLNPTLQFLT